MKNVRFGFVLMLASLTSWSQDYRICNWYKDYQACVVQTYDDMFFNHVTQVAPILISKGMKGTLFVDYDYPTHYTQAGGWSALENIVDSGIEIANHTETHADLKQIAGDPVKMDREIDTFRVFLDDHVTNQKVRTFAYPYGSGMDNQVVKNYVKKNHIGARAAGLPGQAPWNWTYNWYYDFGEDEDQYYYIPTIDENNLFPNNVSKHLSNVLKYGGLMTVMWHNVDSLEHERDMDSIVKYSNGKVWYSNFRDAIMYHREKRTALLATVSESLTEWRLELSDTLDNEVFNHPLSIRLFLAGKTINGIKQNGKNLTYTVSNDTALFDAVPDGGEIVISKVDVVNSSETDFAIHSVYPNPANTTLTINRGSDSQATIWLLNVEGIKVFEQKISTSIVQISVGNLPSGVYLVQEINDHFKTNWSKQVVLKQ